MGLFNKKELKKIAELELELSELKSLQKNIGITDYLDAKKRIEDEQNNFNNLMEKKKIELNNLNDEIIKLQDEIKNLSDEDISLNKKVSNLTNKLDKLKRTYDSVSYSIKNLNDDEITEKSYINEKVLKDIEELSPTSKISLNCLNMHELRKEYRENEKIIKSTLEKYESRYNTKANKAIYKLMVLALQAELQNILVTMKYDKLDKAIKNVEELCNKYLIIAGEGNQSIANTLKKFIGEIQFLFTNAVKIEYEYYIQKQRAKEEQQAIREQMRQEAEEKRELEQQRKQVEKEESKFITERMMKMQNRKVNTTINIILLIICIPLIFNTSLNIIRVLSLITSLLCFYNLYQLRKD